MCGCMPCVYKFPQRPGKTVTCPGVTGSGEPLDKGTGNLRAKTVKSELSLSLDTSLLGFKCTFTMQSIIKEPLRTALNYILWLSRSPMAFWLDSLLVTWNSCHCPPVSELLFFWLNKIYFFLFLFFIYFAFYCPVSPGSFQAMIVSYISV